MAYHMRITQCRAFFLEEHAIPNWGKCIGMRAYHMTEGKSVPTGNWLEGNGELYKLNENNVIEVPDPQTILEQIPGREQLDP